MDHDYFLSISLIPFLRPYKRTSLRLISFHSSNSFHALCVVFIDGGNLFGEKKSLKIVSARILLSPETIYSKRRLVVGGPFFRAIYKMYS